MTDHNPDRLDDGARAEARPTRDEIIAGEVELSNVLSGTDYIMPLDGMERVLTAAYGALPASRTPPKGQVEAVAWQSGGTVAFTPDGVTYSQPSSDDTLDKVASIRDAYAKLKADALDQMELWAAQGATAEVSQSSSEAERHRAALLACNRIISLLETALASPAPAGGAVEGWRVVPTHECPFCIGQPVRLARPCAEENPDTIYYVTGINWEHRLVSNHGWDITIATAEDIEKRYGQTDGYAPSDLFPAAPIPEGK